MDTYEWSCAHIRINMYLYILIREIWQRAKANESLYERMRWSGCEKTGIFGHCWQGALSGCVQLLFERKVDSITVWFLEWYLTSMTNAPCVHHDTSDPLNWISAFWIIVACLYVVTQMVVVENQDCCESQLHLGSAHCARSDLFNQIFECCIIVACLCV